MKKAIHWALSACTATLAACGGAGGDNALMRPGENCLACHAFTAAGTVFPSATSGVDSGISGALVIIVDANGAETTLSTNQAGNFYTNAALAKPLKAVRIVRGGTTTSMVGTPTGACSSCHSLPPNSDAPGRVYAD